MGPRVELKQEPEIYRRALGSSFALRKYADRYPFIESVALFMIFCRKKQRTNAKSGRTKVADWQDVGVEKSTR